LNHDEVTQLINNVFYLNEDQKCFLWIGTDGIFHNTENPNPKDERICCCDIYYSNESGVWYVIPWLYNIDVSGVFKTENNARAFAFFWLNWMESLYGNEEEEPEFEADWLNIKSNRSVISRLFDLEARKFRDDLYKEENNENDKF